MTTTTARANRDVARFEAEGYVVLDELLTREEAADLYDRFDALAPAGVSGARASANERRLLQDPAFFAVLRRPRLLEAVRAVLGDDYQLLAYDSLETAPGGGGRDWHADFSAGIAATLVANCGIYLTDMTDETGPLYVVPGSHRSGGQPPEGAPSLEGEVGVPLTAGSAVLFDAQLWHTGSGNRSGRPRRAVFPYFGKYWLKRMDEFAATPLPEYVTSSDDPVVRQLFGLGLTVPSVHGADYNADNPRWR